MEEIPHHLGCQKPCKQFGITHMLTGAGFLPSTVCSTFVMITVLHLSSLRCGAQMFLLSDFSLVRQREEVAVLLKTSRKNSTMVSDDKMHDFLHFGTLYKPYIPQDDMNPERLEHCSYLSKQYNKYL